METLRDIVARLLLEILSEFLAEKIKINIREQVRAESDDQRMGFLDRMVAPLMKKVFQLVLEKTAPVLFNSFIVKLWKYVITYVVKKRTHPEPIHVTIV